MAFTTFSGRGGAMLALLVLVVCGAVLISPASTATKYLGGSPVLSASVSGVNEFVPGEDATLQVLVKNTGVSTMKQLDQGTISPDDLPTTAKFVMLGLTSPTNSIIVKSDPQMVGTLPAGGTGTTVKYKVKISTNATIGEYQLPLVIDYEYPQIIQQEKADVFEYTYNKATVSLPVTVRIKPEVKIAVVEAVPDTLNAGTEGYVSLKIRNDGPEDGSKASVKIARSGSSAIIPTDSTAFVGDFPSGSVVSCRFKIAASKDATAQTYPVDVLVTYTNREGTEVTSDAETIGIPVNGKTTFTVTSPVPSVTAGSHSTIGIEYRNNGNTTVYETQARLTLHGDMTINNNVAYLGEIRPGESAIATFDIEAGSNAGPATTSFDSTLRFRDALGNSQESDTIPVSIQVLPAKGSAVAGIPVTLLAGGILLVIIAAGVLLYYQRKKRMQ